MSNTSHDFKGSHDFKEFEFMVEYIDGGQIEYISDSKPFYRKIMDVFPMSFSRIDWSSLPHFVVYIDKEYPDSKEDIFNNVSSIFRNEKIDENTLVYVCFDGHTKGTFKMKLKLFIQLADEIVTYPQHTYVIPEDANWCFNFSIENGMYFGYHR